jgi:hypothetical protein
MMQNDAMSDAKMHPWQRRTTVTLPAELIERAEKVAEAQHASLNSVLVTAIERGLPQVRTPEYVEQLLQDKRESLEGFTEWELLALQGIILEPIGPDNPEPDESGW